MKIFKKHQSLNYLLNRLINKIIFATWGYNKPWITPKAIQYLNKYFEGINFKGNLFEWGAGKSTIWFARKNYSVISVENSEKWFNIISKKLEEKNIKNASIILRNDNPKVYVDEIKKHPDNFFDSIVIDGIERANCAIQAIPKLKLGGVLIIDDIHRYLSIKSNVPYSIFNHNIPEDESWISFKKQILNWKQIITSDGVRDTAIFIKQ